MKHGVVYIFRNYNFAAGFDLSSLKC